MFVPQALIQTIAFEITFALGETEKRRIVWKAGWLPASSERQAVRSHNTRPTFYSSLCFTSSGVGGARQPITCLHLLCQLTSQPPSLHQCASSQLFLQTSCPPAPGAPTPPWSRPDPERFNRSPNAAARYSFPLSPGRYSFISHITPATFSPAVTTCLHVRFPTSSPLSDCWPWAPPDTR